MTTGPSPDQSPIPWHLSESRYRRVFETALDGILLLNFDSAQIEDSNPYLVHMLGYSHQELLGKKLWDVGAFADIAQCQAMFNELRETGHVRYDNLPLKTRAGATLEVEFISNSYYCDETKVIQCNIRDISARKVADAELQRANVRLAERAADWTASLERATRDLDSFSYSVAHDLRAPLRAMTGFSSMLVEINQGRLDAQSTDYLQRIHVGAQRMTSLIDNLLELARISRAPVSSTDFDFSALALEAATPLFRLYPAQRVELTVAPGMQAHGDSHLIRILLDNLLANAWKFSRHVAHARIAVGHQAGADGTVYFVRDNGAGFDMKYVNKLFEPFQRLHGQHEFEGTGIGLSIVQRIVSRHDGSIWADGVVGQGATIFFTLHGAASPMATSA